MKLLSLLMLVFFSTVCSAQIKAVGDAPLILEIFNLATPITVLYPAKNKSREYADFYEIRSPYSLLGYHQVVKEVIYEIEPHRQLKKPVGTEYRQQSSSSADRLALFGKQFFNRVNVVTTPNNRIKLIGVATTMISHTESENFIKYLTIRYGRPKILKGSFDRVFKIYDWQTKDRTFRYAQVFADEKNVLKLNVDQIDRTVTSAKRDPHLEGYFYIIKNEYIKTIAQYRNGDFAYLNED